MNKNNFLNTLTIFLLVILLINIFLTSIVIRVRQLDVGKAQIVITHDVIFDGTAFVPSQITIYKGDTVKWTNNSSDHVEIASDPHPIHTDYPPLNLGHVLPGNSVTLTFNDVGVFTYHNHLNSTMIGKVTVEHLPQPTATNSPTSTPTPTISPTPLPSATPTLLNTPNPTSTSTPTPTKTPIPTPTGGGIGGLFQPTSTPTLVSTPTPTSFLLERANQNINIAETRDSLTPTPLEETTVTATDLTQKTEKKSFIPYILVFMGLSLVLIPLLFYFISKNKANFSGPTISNQTLAPPPDPNTPENDHEDANKKEK